MNISKVALFITLLFFTIDLTSQNIVDVTEQTLKISGLNEETFLYGFAAGDQMIFNFTEVDGKELKEIEILEYTGSSKFMDYKTAKIEDKKLNIQKTGIYKFRFSNGNLKGRICKIKIQRIPASAATQNFDPTVYWRIASDTTYTTLNEKYLIKADTAVLEVFTQNAKVHSQGNLNGSKNTINFVLPDNTISWSYYVGVDQVGQQAFTDASMELTNNAAPLLLKIPGYGPLAALALGGISYLSLIQKGEDIDYWIVDNYNVALFKNGSAFNCYKKGKVVNDFARMQAPLKGMLHFCLSNDNAITGVVVMVKVTAITVNEQWGTREVKKMNVATRDEAYLKE